MLDLPLFSRYLFCRCNRERLSRVSNLSCVANVVGFGGQSVIIPEHQIAAIRKLVASGLSLSPCPFLREGTIVRIREGPLMDVIGRLLKIRNDYRLVVSVEMLNRSISVEVPPEIIEQI
jgi:transcription antitermination factor NusG